MESRAFIILVLNEMVLELEDTTSSANAEYEYEHEYDQAKTLWLVVRSGCMPVMSRDGYLP
jgi:hypothetical protein